ncbi:hypothetical protein J6590_018766 [Homalodisca vitripennis]|nr:hypothetical protein J6590_018766 [Homalodisca vitripennis]
MTNFASRRLGNGTSISPAASSWAIISVWRPSSPRLGRGSRNYKGLRGTELPSSANYRLPGAADHLPSPIELTLRARVIGDGSVTGIIFSSSSKTSIAAAAKSVATSSIDYGF